MAAGFKALSVQDEDEKSPSKDCKTSTIRLCEHYWSYIIVAIKGAIWCTIISSIYSLLSGSVSLKAFEEEDRPKHCDRDDHKCSAERKLDLLHDPQYRDFLELFIVLAIFTAICCFFSVVHDWSLVYYRRTNDMGSLHFWPSDPKGYHKDDYILSKCLALCCYSPLTKAAEKMPKYMKYCCGLIFRPILILWILVGWIDFIILILIFRTLCHCKPLCKGIMEVSSVWVGFSSLGMTVCAYFLTNFFNIAAWSRFFDDGDECCDYVLKPWDYAQFLFAQIVLMIQTVLFLAEWKEEISPSRYYLYLVPYTIPIWNTVAVNPDDLALSRMAGVDEKGSEVVRDLQTATINDDAANENAKRYRQKYFDAVCFVTLMTVLASLGGAIMNVDDWGWPQWIATGLVVILYTGMVIVVVFMLWFGYHVTMSKAGKEARKRDQLYREQLSK